MNLTGTLRSRELSGPRMARPFDRAIGLHFITD